MIQQQQVIEEIRKSISEADTSKALRQMLDFLKANPQHKSLDKITRLAQSKYESARRNLNQGVISVDNADLDFNMVNRTLLQLLEDIENDTFQLERYEPDMRPNLWQKKLIGLLSGILIVLAAGLGYWIYTNNLDSSKFTCPVFKANSVFNVLLLPFQPNIQDKLAPHITIKRRLTNKSEAQNLNTSIEIATDYFEKNDTPGKEEATIVGKECGAQLIIWGVWENIPASGTIVSTDFKYLGDTLRFGFQKLKLESGGRIDTVFSMSNIETQGKLTQEIEKIIDTYFGLIAGLSGQSQASIDALEKSIPAPSDTAAFLLSQTTLANSYLSLGKPMEAEKVYDAILEVQPKDGLTRNNRGVLLYQKGLYGEAIEDFSVKLQETPNDVDALSSRASVYLKTEELKKAAEDLERAKKCDPKLEGLEEKTKVLEDKKIKHQTKIKDATTKLKMDKNDTKALNERAKSYRSMGEYELAIEDAEKAIKLNAKSKDAYETIIKTYNDKKEPVKAKELLKEAKSKGIDMTKIKPPITINEVGKN